MSADENSSLKSNKKQNYGTTETSSTTSVVPTEINSIDTLPDTTILPQNNVPDNDSIPPDQMKSTLSFLQKIGFGLGHIYNDLCAGVWFSYTLLFLQKALLIAGPKAGALMMLGQVGDALATPIIGVLTDKYGTKRKWHIAGNTTQCHSSSRNHFDSFSSRYRSSISNIPTDIFHMSVVFCYTDLVDANIFRYCNFIIPIGMGCSSNYTSGYDTRNV